MAPKLTQNVIVRVRPRQVAFWRAAAAEEDISLSELLRRAADAYVRQRLVDGATLAGADR